MKYGSSASPPSGTAFGKASAAVTVPKQVLAKLTGSPSHVYGTVAPTKSSIFAW